MRRLLLLLVLALLASGCGVLRARPCELTARIVNDGNCLLTVEGTSDLPEGSPIEAILREGEQHLLARARAPLKGGRYALTLDLSQAPGNTALGLEVSFDSMAAPPEVVFEVGPGGSRLVGPQVERARGRSVVVERMRVVLPMNPREGAIRKVVRGDYAAGIAVLEQVVDRNPADLEATGWLALALLARNPAERRPGSRAHSLLSQVMETPQSAAIRSQGRVWLDRLEREEVMDQRRAEAEARHREAAENRARRAAVVRPGRALGLLDVGMEAGKIFSMMAPDRYPTWGQPGVESVAFPKHPDLQVDFDASTGRAIRLRTTSETYRLEGDLGVGSPFLAFQLRYPGITAAFRPPEVGPDGTRSALGECAVEGLELTVRRTFDPAGPPVDTVEALAVVAPSAPAGDPSPTAPPPP